MRKSSVFLLQNGQNSLGDEVATLQIYVCQAKPCQGGVSCECLSKSLHVVALHRFVWHVTLDEKCVRACRAKHSGEVSNAMEGLGLTEGELCDNNNVVGLTCRCGQGLQGQLICQLEPPPCYSQMESLISCSYVTNTTCAECLLDSYIESLVTPVSQLATILRVEFALELPHLATALRANKLQQKNCISVCSVKRREVTVRTLVARKQSHPHHILAFHLQKAQLHYP